MNLNDIISANLKKLRTDRNLSLGQLSELSGVSKVMLSQIEKGESNPTINTIWKIANGLQVTYTKLIDSPMEDAVVIHKVDTKKQSENTNSFISYCYYTTNPNRNFELFKVEVKPHCEYNSDGHAPKTQEYILVDRGELTIQLATGKYVLKEGDSIHFDCYLPHIFINHLDTMLEFTDIIYYL
ncbi:XRE family transcriptional regulator [Clostridium botulinum]|uniref:Helix-turn-helix transcriptional regulator n=2 Tax=Clostridium botulinum TaxID=1491 RepID=A0ABD7CLP5_CLOBO|nr:MULTISPECIES: XRE family transcriptional regulator [Clostridium]APF27305.1 helix-turn-helix family protein [Clostridium sporogenes]AUN02345.1 transcriptional regulator [Clostridium botulinum]KGO14541.1 transcriptional regulator [Clostridium botulinum]KIN80420.1 transcriptional regulator [Clostridium botulinum]KYN76063.1 transcriptional regulator [Clostridium sporogenes]